MAKKINEIISVKVRTFCSNHHIMMPVGDYCPDCGELRRIERGEWVAKCSECGEVVLKEHKYCIWCGAKFEE